MENVAPDRIPIHEVWILLQILEYADESPGIRTTTNETLLALVSFEVMYIPHHWAEALSHAQDRLNEAVGRWQSQPQVVSLRERKVPYNGADGIPIREEIIDEGEGYVITRNSYDVQESKLFSRPTHGETLEMWLERADASKVGVAYSGGPNAGTGAMDRAIRVHRARLCVLPMARDGGA